MFKKIFSEKEVPHPSASFLPNATHPIPIYGQMSRRSEAYGHVGPSTAQKGSPFLQRAHRSANLEQRPSNEIRASNEIRPLNEIRPSSPAQNSLEQPEEAMVNHIGPLGSLGPIGLQVGGIFCSECHGEGRGVFYSCTVCKNYFLCSDCENRGVHDQHIMVRVSSGVSPR